jgi:hypothetical protein
LKKNYNGKLIFYLGIRYDNPALINPLAMLLFKPTPAEQSNCKLGFALQIKPPLRPGAKFEGSDKLT